LSYRHQLAEEEKSSRRRGRMSKKRVEGIIRKYEVIR